MLQDHQKTFIFKLWVLWLIAIFALIIIRLTNDYLSFSGYYSYLSVKPDKTSFENVIPGILTIAVPLIILCIFGVFRFLQIRHFKEKEPTFKGLSLLFFVAIRFALREYFLRLYDAGQITFLTIELYEYASYIMLMLLDITYTITFFKLASEQSKSPAIQE